ncbi:MAG: hypothetical protein HOV96_32865 [Nonomuraea sp.]|nr:hypothetical protein [Nonomuraea sp.]NUP66593.1 hypothetical protein [Nonomuraea sp.]NUP82345.1 hypothetical protein [Nonomuraea sp.]NUS07771.1 hypothetical protein [Nonomuraea sp.]
MKRLIVIAGLLTTTACGAVPGLGGESPRHDQTVKYAQCLRGHGVAMSDPPPGEDGMSLDTRGVPRDKLEAALKSCQSLRPSEPPVSAEDLEGMRKMAACLRRNGVDASDPTAASPGIRVGSPPPGKDLDAISAACKKEVEG